MSDPALAAVAIAAVFGAGIGLIIGGAMFARVLYSATHHH